MIGLFLGKFQPFHKGHLQAVQYILRDCDEVKIAIGSSQYHGTEDNPFTLEQRQDMLRLALAEADIHNYKLGAIADIGNHGLWVDTLIENFSPFDTFFTRNREAAFAVGERGVRVRQHPPFGEFSGREIRKRVREGKPWGELVPPAVANYIKSI